jgi:transcriptional regulator with XRE-family HTH domain
MAASYAHRSMRNPDVAALLARARTAAGLSQVQAACLAGISTGTVSMLEHGKRRPSTVVAGRLADVYRMPDVARELLMDEALPNVGKASPWHSVIWRQPVVKRRGQTGPHASRRQARTPW